MEEKKWYQSKIFWTGVVLFIGNGLNALSKTVSPEVAGYISSALGVIVIMFRAFTGEAIAFGKKVFGKKT